MEPRYALAETRDEWMKNWLIDGVFIVYGNFDIYHYIKLC